MPRKALIPIVFIVALAVAGALYLHRAAGPVHYTGFVEGEERVIRSEVSGRVLEVKYAEGDVVPANAVLAVLDAQDIATRLKTKEQELAVLDADIATQEERIRLTETTWQRDRNASQADLHAAESAADLAQKTLAREQGLVHTGASTAQQLDDSRGRRDQAQSALERSRQMLARTEAEERTIALARNELAALRERYALTQAQRDELLVTRAKSEIRAPGVETRVQTQFLWPGELAQPGIAVLSVLDSADKYVQVFVPVAEVGQLSVGRKVEIELDSRPGHRVPGEISFIADKANFTPEKIETRSDRLGQVYRVKIRILDGADRLQPGTEGNVYLVGEDGR